MCESTRLVTLLKRRLHATVKREIKSIHRSDGEQEIEKVRECNV